MRGQFAANFRETFTHLALYQPQIRQWPVCSRDLENIRK